MSIAILIAMCIYSINWIYIHTQKKMQNILCVSISEIFFPNPSPFQIPCSFHLCMLSSHLLYTCFFFLDTAAQTNSHHLYTHALHSHCIEPFAHISAQRNNGCYDKGLPTHHISNIHYFQHRLKTKTQNTIFLLEMRQDGPFGHICTA